MPRNKYGRYRYLRRKSPQNTEMLYCGYCKSKQSYRTYCRRFKNGSRHLAARCKVCQTFIKWLLTLNPKHGQHESPYALVNKKLVISPDGYKYWVDK